ncbi:hypothetical protein [Qipengyuania sp. YIM B01966]|uniref:hypothetical protein n=1 Tax=Qipengyuania sp. YIM B01966 TaxID=2778646 RepID=UPI0026A4B407
MSAPAPPPGDWHKAAFAACALGAQANAVIWLRLSMLAWGGPGARREAQRMVGEKLEANWALAVALATGGLGTDPAAATEKAIEHYAAIVRANHRRLSGPPARRRPRRTG